LFVPRFATNASHNYPDKERLYCASWVAHPVQAGSKDKTLHPKAPSKKQVYCKDHKTDQKHNL
jgi:hypothetical protein